MAKTMRNGERKSAIGPTSVVLFSLGSMLALAVAMSSYSYDLWAGFLFAPILMLTVVPMSASITKLTGDNGVGRIVLYGGFLKILIGTAVQYYITYFLYTVSDAARYSRAGTDLAPQFRALDFSDLGAISGTRFAEVLTGIVYAVTGRSVLAGFLVFSWLAFIGIYLFIRAFAIAMPTGRIRLFAGLMFLSPSLLTWTSSIGKEAWIMLMLGMSILGTVRLLSGKAIRGAILLGLGIWGAAVMRPHIALLLVLAFAVALVVRALSPGARRAATGPHEGSSAWRRVALVGSLVLAVAAAVLVTAAAETFFGLDSLNPESAEQVLTELADDSQRGGSEFSPPSPTSPAGYAFSVVSVTSRPFIFEARSPQMAIAAIEGGALLIFTALAIARGRQPIRRSIATSHLFATALAFWLGFSYLFASVANFGILARQRAQVVPFLFIVIAVGFGQRRDPTSARNDALPRGARGSGAERSPAAEVAERDQSVAA